MIVVVVDGTPGLRSHLGVGRLLREGPEVGVYVIWVDRSARLLPAECQAVAVFGRDGLRVEQTLANTVSGVRADRVDPGWCARVARSLAPVRDAGEADRLPGPAAGGQRPAPLAAPVAPAGVRVTPIGWPALGRPARAAVAENEWPPAVGI